MLNNINYKSALFLFAFACLFGTSCKKYLDEKTDKKLVVPSSLQDLQAILDYTPNMALDPGSDEVSADNYYLSTADWLAMPQEGQRRIYVWEKDNFFDVYSNDWADTYRKVYYANTVLDNLEKIDKTTSNSNDWQHIQAQALFARARSFFQVVNIWSMPYNAASSAIDLGIPLRLKADFTETSVRPSVEQTYQQIIGDLKKAIPALPVIAVHPIRASRPAALAMLSRVYLSMRDYGNAGLYSDSSLQLYNNLIDYNSLSATAAYPIAQFNTETLFYGVTGPRQLSMSRCKIDSALYQSYAVNDIRKTIFFKDNGNGSFAFKGSYDGATGSLFTGLATDEMYLTRAECYARNNDITKAITDLNTLLIKRYKTGTLIPITASSNTDALGKILVERRKELVMRGTRWMDIRRLNKEGANINLKRVVNTQTYTLLANDKRFALPLPEDVISLSGMPQNPR